MYVSTYVHKAKGAWG